VTIITNRMKEYKMNKMNFIKMKMRIWNLVMVEMIRLNRSKPKDQIMLIVLKAKQKVNKQNINKKKLETHFQIWKLLQTVPIKNHKQN